MMFGTRHRATAMMTSCSSANGRQFPEHECSDVEPFSRIVNGLRSLDRELGAVRDE
jgi:hypothetical protein